jgi:hypothetical protein
MRRLDLPYGSMSRPPTSLTGETQAVAEAGSSESANPYRRGVAWHRRKSNEAKRVNSAASAAAH